MKTHNEKFKEKVIHDYQSGTSIKELIERYQISKSTIYNWLKEEKTIINFDKTKSVPYREYSRMKQERDIAMRDLEIYKKLHCFNDAQIREKEEAIKNFIDIYPIKVMCKLLDLPKGTFYNFHLRKPEKTKHQLRDEIIKPEILKIYNKSNGRFGAKKILAKLRTNGIKTALIKVQALIKDLNIESTQKRKKKELPVKSNTHYFANKLKRVFNQDAPNKFWVGDVTELRVGPNKFYLCVIIDLFSRKVIAYRLSSQNNVNLTINTFKDAFESRNRPANLSFHSDQGTNYTAY